MFISVVPEDITNVEIEWVFGKTVLYVRYNTCIEIPTSELALCWLALLVFIVCNNLNSIALIWNKTLNNCFVCTVLKS